MIYLQSSRAFWKRAGVPELPIVANLAWIRSKHTNEFKDDAAVEAHIRFVLNADQLLAEKGKARETLLFVPLGSQKCAVVQFVSGLNEEGHRVYRVLSAYTLTTGQSRRLASGEGCAPVGSVPGSSGSGREARKPGCQGPALARASRRDKSTPARKPRKANPAAFGTKERRKAYGSHEGGSRSGARAQRRRDRQASRASTRRAEETLERLSRLQADGKRLTKTQDAALQRATARLQQEGALPDDARLSELAAEHQAAERSLDAILGPERKAYAVKVAREDRPFTAEDVEAYQRAGWAVRAAGTVPAKVGARLSALNPSSLDRILGPRHQARAMVLLSRVPFGEDTLFALRGDGLDLSPAPKSLRTIGQQGTHGDTARGPAVNPGSMKQTRAAKAGQSTKPSRSNPVSAARMVYDALVKAAKAGESVTAFDLVERVKLALDTVERLLVELAAEGLAHITGRNLYGTTWAPGAEARGLNFNPTGRAGASPRKRHGTSAAKKAPSAERRTRLSKSNPLRKGSKEAKERMQELRGLKADKRIREEGGPFMIGDREAREARARVEAKNRARRVSKINPSDPEALARVWEDWTGEKADRSFHLEVTQARRLGLPSKVALLGRLAWLATAKGEVKRFGDSGPLLVTDEHMRKAWILSATPRRFDLYPSLIAYHVRKPKFGDRGTVEYVHAFEGKAHAVIDGQVGALTGTFRITPAGLEG